MASAAKIRSERFEELARWKSEWRGLVGNKQERSLFSCERLSKMKMETHSRILVGSGIVHYWHLVWDKTLWITNYRLWLDPLPEIETNGPQYRPDGVEDGRPDQDISEMNFDSHAASRNYCSETQARILIWSVFVLPWQDPLQTCIPWITYCQIWLDLLSLHA